MPTETPARFDLYNEQSTKKISLVVKIEGVSDLLSSRTIYTRFRFGDSIVFGEEGLVYGGLRKIAGTKDILSLEGSSVSISQKLEPEQGRSSVSTLSLAFVDVDQYMTRLVSPGVVVDDILGKNITVFLGYEEISFPEDFFVIFRGKITGTTSGAGLVTFQISDPNISRRQRIFYCAKTKLSSALTASATTVAVDSNGDFFKHVLGPSGTYDAAIKLYIKVEDEFIEYGPTASRPSGTFGTNQFGNVLRGARGSVAAVHEIGSDVQACIEISDQGLDMALKLMLSGWGGPWKTGVAIDHLNFSPDPALTGLSKAIILPTKVDAVKDYGLAVGEYITVSGATNASNNKTVRVSYFGELFGEPNRIIYTDSAFVKEKDSPAVAAFRSQFDTYPALCGVKLTPEEVDLDTHISIRDTYLGTGDYQYRFLIQGEETCKSFIESEILLPMSAYSLTKNGRLSMGFTHPPIADETLLFLDETNILDPGNIKPQRAVNNRKFFNEVSWEYDQADNGNYAKTVRYLDTESLSIIGISSVLPIKSRGAKSALGFDNIADRISRRILSRYKRGAISIQVKTNWGVGCKIEAGDIVALRDNGALQISNFATGERDLGTQLFEVSDRNLDIKSGTVSLTLTSGITSALDDRFGTISPSSIIKSGSTSSRIVIQDSYGALYPGNEKRKWTDFVGEKVLVRSENWAVESECTLLGFDEADPSVMLVQGLSITPQAGYIVDIIRYPDTTDKTEAQTYKIIHAFLTPTVSITAGVSQTEFSVSASNIGKFFVGAPIRVHSESYSADSGETDIYVQAINTITNRVTTTAALGFTPSAGHLVDLIGFKDGQGPYRWVG